MKLEFTPRAKWLVFAMVAYGLFLLLADNGARDRHTGPGRTFNAQNATTVCAVQAGVDEADRAHRVTPTEAAAIARCMDEFLKAERLR